MHGWARVSLLHRPIQNEIRPYINDPIISYSKKKTIIKIDHAKTTNRKLHQPIESISGDTTTKKQKKPNVINNNNKKTDDCDDGGWQYCGRARVVVARWSPGCRRQTVAARAGRVTSEPPAARPGAAPPRPRGGAAPRATAARGGQPGARGMHPPLHSDV